MPVTMTVTKPTVRHITIEELPIGHVGLNVCGSQFLVLRLHKDLAVPLNGSVSCYPSASNSFMDKYIDMGPLKVQIVN